MKRRNFIRNTGLGIAGLALSNSIYGKDLSTRKSLNVFILMSGGVCFNDIIDVKNNSTLKLFNECANVALNCRTNVNYTGQSMEHTAAMITVLQTLKDDSVKKFTEVNYVVKLDDETGLVIGKRKKIGDADDTPQNDKYAEETGDYRNVPASIKVPLSVVYGELRIDDKTWKALKSQGKPAASTGGAPKIKPTSTGGVPKPKSTPTGGAPRPKK
jgi:hypothetical protein